MQFTVSFDMDNAAFDNEDAAESPSYTALSESARILQIIVSRLENGETRGHCRDINGNHVGEWRVES